MENNNDLDFIKARLNDLPEVTLPSSLSAESLWARIDSGELTTHNDQPQQSKVIQWVVRMRPALSYAAVFIVMVAVYYGAGLDSAPNTMPVPTTEDQIMMAAPAMDAPQDEHSKFRMATTSENGSSTSPEAPLPMLAAPSPQNEIGADTNSIDSTQLNPNTSGLNAVEAENYTLLAEEYTKSVDNAVAMEKYLLSTLSPRDYGGMYVQQLDTVSLNIWVLNKDVVDKAIANYTGNSCEVQTEPARCSLEDLKLFVGVLDRISLNEGETLRAYVSETDNTVAVNIAKSGDDRLRKRIGELSEENNIPSDCITIFTIDPASPNVDSQR